jgi:beta-glucosidase
MRGPWWSAAAPEQQVSVLAGLREALPRTEIRYAAGVGIEDADASGIAEALELCEGAEAVLLCLGEAASMSGEAASRAHLGLPGRQRELAEAALERAERMGVPTIALLFCGRPLAVPWLTVRASATLAAWFPGSEAGRAVGDLLLGRRSPSGRTPVTWPRAAGQIPVHFAERPSGRPTDPTQPYSSRYLDESTQPLFAFGHGLTYGRFLLSDLRVSPEIAGEADTVQVRVDVQNVGAHSAQETLFLFTRRMRSVVAPPLLELKGVGQIALRPGERGTLALGLAVSQLRSLGQDLESVLEPGELEVLIGPRAERAVLLSARLTLRT